MRIMTILVSLISLQVFAQEDYVWIHWGGSYYSMTQDYSSWQEAQDEAASLGGYLAVINSEEENVFLSEYITEARVRSYKDITQNIAWIGYHKVGEEWVWVNGDPVIYTNYYYLWPQSGSKVYLHGDQHFNGPSEWNANNITDINYDYQPKGIIEVPSAPPTITLNVAVDPNDIGVNTVNPLIGEHNYTQNMMLNISAEQFSVCPDVYVFDHWEGDVVDQYSSNTSVFLDADKTITAVYVSSQTCGDKCHPYPYGDVSKDCSVDLYDISIIAQNWLECTKPECD